MRKLEEFQVGHLLVLLITSLLGESVTFTVSAFCNEVAGCDGFIKGSVVLDDGTLTNKSKDKLCLFRSACMGYIH
jgi:hypothetical protein